MKCKPLKDLGCVIEALSEIYSDYETMLNGNATLHIPQKKRFNQKKRFDRIKTTVYLLLSDIGSNNESTMDLSDLEAALDYFGIDAKGTTVHSYLQRINSYLEKYNLGTTTDNGKIVYYNITKAVCS